MLISNKEVKNGALRPKTEHDAGAGRIAQDSAALWFWGRLDGLQHALCLRSSWCLPGQLGSQQVPLALRPTKKYHCTYSRSCAVKLFVLISFFRLGYLWEFSLAPLVNNIRTDAFPVLGTDLNVVVYWRIVCSSYWVWCVLENYFKNRGSDEASGSGWWAKSLPKRVQTRPHLSHVWVQTEPSTTAGSDHGRVFAVPLIGSSSSPPTT